MYRFNAIPINILANICGNLQADSKMYKEMLKANNSQDNPEKEQS